jgi:hypothetical protein
MPPVPTNASPRETTAALGQAYWAFRDKATLRPRSSWLLWVETENVEAVPSYTTSRYMSLRRLSADASPRWLLGSPVRHMIIARAINCTAGWR